MEPWSQIARGAGIRERIAKAVSVLNEYLAKGYYVYGESGFSLKRPPQVFEYLIDIGVCSGANTGYGGNADTRTDRLIDIQKALLQLTQSGVLTEHDKTEIPQDCYLQDPVSHSMPLAWVKGMMVVRCNATVRGHSGVSMEAVDAILGLLDANLIPIIPLKDP